MNKFNITPAQVNALAAKDLGIEFSEVRHTYPNGKEVTLDTVEIYDDCSDFTVIYTINRDGTLNFYCAPEYIEDLPAKINSTKELTAVVKFVAEAA